MREVIYKTKAGTFAVGKFHGFFQDTEAFEYGHYSYPCAIIEEEDGAVIVDYANNIQFVSPGKEGEVDEGSEIQGT